MVVFTITFIAHGPAGLRHASVGIIVFVPQTKQVCILCTVNIKYEVLNSVALTPVAVFLCSSGPLLSQLHILLFDPPLCVLCCLQMVVGVVAGQITLIGYLSLRQGLQQWPFLLPLPVIVLYLSSRYSRPFCFLSIFLCVYVAFFAHFWKKY